MAPSVPAPVLVAVYTSLCATLLREFTADYSLVMIGSYNMWTHDVVIAAILYAIARLVSRERVKLSIFGLLVFGLVGLLALSLLRGAVDDPFGALFGIRSIAPVIGFIALGACLSGRQLQYTAVKRAFVYIAVAAALLAYARAALGAEFLYFGAYDRIEEIFEGGRVMSSSGALVIGSTLLFLLADTSVLGQESKRTFLIIFLSVALLMTQQASAIFATGTGILIMFTLAPGATRLMRIVLASAAACFLALAFAAGTSILTLLPDWLIGSRERRTGTLEWRRSIWEQVIAEFKTWSDADKIFGLPSHQKPEIWLNNELYLNSVHSQYLGSLTQVGVAGLTIYLVIVLGLFLTAVRKAADRRSHGWTSALMGGFCALLIVFGYTYEIRPENAVLLALAMAHVETRPSKKRRRAPRFTQRAPSSSEPAAAHPGRLSRTESRQL